VKWMRRRGRCGASEEGGSWGLEEVVSERMRAEKRLVRLFGWDGKEDGRGEKGG
jgi:hypothetical protein